MAAIQNYLKPDTLEEAAALLADCDRAAIIAGGTDLLLQLQAGKVSDCTLVDIGGIAELAKILLTEKELSIGAATKLSEVERSNLLTGSFEMLKTAASWIGSPQIRSMATIGGNLCNASPSADMSAPLLALDARVELRSNRSQRTISLVDFFLGPSKTVLAPGEMLTAVRIPHPPAHSASTYRKHSPRRAMDLAIVGVSVLMWRTDHQLQVRIGLSAIAPTPIRARQAEDYLSGRSSLDEQVLEGAAASVLEEIRPISDIRASARYREAMAALLTKQALAEVYARLG